MKITVDYDKLIAIVHDLVESFNDCACCPCYFDCLGDNEKERLDVTDCSLFIIDKFLKPKFVQNDD